jgi:regulator of replication initiation timing
MAEYRIVAKLDPQTAAGTSKVKQDLRGIQSEARATETALNRSFDQAKFERSIGGLTKSINALDKSINSMMGSGQSLRRSNESLGQSLDRVAASGTKAAGATAQSSRAADSATASNSKYEASLLRVLRAIDQEAAEQQQMNMLLAEAKRLRDAGALSQEHYARVQELASRSAQEQANITGMQRIGLQQLGFQLGDVATMYALGARPSQIFASQIGQVTQAVMLLSGGTSKLAAFLGGPWGIALTFAVLALGPFIGKLFEGNDALGDSIDKLRKDANETEANRQAKEAFSRTLEGQIALQRELNKELDKSILTQRQQAQMDLDRVQRNVGNLRGRVPGLEEQITSQESVVEGYRDQIRNPGRYGLDPGGIAGTVLVLRRAEEQLQRLKDQLRQVNTEITNGERAVREAALPIIQENVEAQLDKQAAALLRYTKALGMLNQQRAIGEGNRGRVRVQQEDGTFRDQVLEGISEAEYTKRLAQAMKARDDAVKAAQQAERSAQSTIATFRSREQAIGIAGREFQRAGFSVGENFQFGKVGNHPGMGRDAHGKFAIDVNAGKGVVEADVPELKAQFDQAARRYQQRGYRVLWNGWVYEANGDGPTRRIPAGQHQHRDHMHLEAPQTIVGKPTQASTEAQFAKEASEAAKLEARAADFVQSVVIKAAQRGLPNNSEAALQGEIDEAFAEFERRFDRAATFAEKWTIATALTDADAREQAQAFDEAYVQPLKRLEALQGKVGIDRQILNAQLDEAKRRGRELTAAEKEAIDIGIRRSDALTREAEILQQINGPIEQYRTTLEALNALLERGAISQANYNARVAELGGAAASQFKGGLPGNNAGGVPFAEAAAREEAARERDNQLAQLEQYLAQGTIMEEEAAAIRAGIWKQYANQMREVDNMRLSNARDFFGQLAQLQNSKNREIAAVGKAAAVTTATIDAYVAINKALATLPPPFNIAMAGAIGATALANVAQIIGLKDGGRVSGPGGPRGDRVPAMLSDGEFVVNADATSRNLPLLEAINSGRTAREAGYAERAAAGVAVAGAAPVVVPAPVVNLRAVNVLDPSIVGDYLSSPEGEQLFVNLVNQNPDVIRQVAGTGVGN